jgi:hypothetical protein
MKREHFNKGFAALVAAFPLSDRSTAEQQEVYWLILREVPDEIWSSGVQKALRESTFFPTIHDLGVACFGEQKEEWVEKCDPWRSRQFYKEHIAPETWQQRMEKIVHPAIEGPTDQPQLEAPKVKVVVRPCDHQKEIDELYAEVRRLTRENEELKAKPRMSPEERKAMLRDQARVLAAESKAP